MCPPGITLWSGTWRSQMWQSKKLTKKELVYCYSWSFQIGCNIKVLHHPHQTHMSKSLTLVLPSTFCHFCHGILFYVFPEFSQMSSNHFYDVKLDSTHVTLQERVIIFIILMLLFEYISLCKFPLWFLRPFFLALSYKVLYYSDIL